MPTVLKRHIRRLSKKQTGGKRTRRSAGAAKRRSSHRRRRRSSKGIKAVVLKKGKLTRFGYHANLSKEVRHRSLRKATKKYGKSSVVKSLSIVATRRKNNDPALSKIFKDDMHFVQKLKSTKSKKKGTKSMRRK